MDPKKDPRDLTLKELPEFCASMEGCNDCPLFHMDGPCQPGSLPCNWSLSDGDIELATIQTAAADLAQNLTAALSDFGEKIKEAVAAMVDSLTPSDVETIKTLGGDTITYKVNRGAADD